MDRIVVRPSGPLSGPVSLPGAKNSVLKLIAATLLADGEHEISNVPGIADVPTMCDLLGALGVQRVPVDPVAEPGVLRLRNSGDITPMAPCDLVEQIRASVNVLGPLLGRFGYAKISLPGGDDFGSRPIDMHVKGLEALGATFEIDDRSIEARADVLCGADISLPYPSVGATENILMAAVVAKGTTVLDNAAREPEIVDLCSFLQEMGAQIDGAGTSALRIEGVEASTLRPAAHRVVSDRVQAATYLAALGVCGGDIFVEDGHADHMEMLVDRFTEMGMEIDQCDGGIRAVCDVGRLHSVDVSTLPYPGVATDYKPLVVTMLSVADGVGIVTENLYPGRFRYVEELQRLGAQIRTDGHHAVVRGVPRLTGAQVHAADIRAGAALVVAGLAADGETVIDGVHHIDRGYEDLVGRLRSIGADIERLS